MIGRAVVEAAAAKPNGEPIAARVERHEGVAAGSHADTDAGRRLPWPRGKRPWIYAGLAIAAAVLVMVLNPPAGERGPS